MSTSYDSFTNNENVSFKSSKSRRLFQANYKFSLLQQICVHRNFFSACIKS